MFGVLVIIGKKVGKVPDAGTWALESFSTKKKFLKKSIQTVLNNVSLASKQRGHFNTNKVFIDSR